MHRNPPMSVSSLTGFVSIAVLIPRSAYGQRLASLRERHDGSLKVFHNILQNVGVRFCEEFERYSVDIILLIKMPYNKSRW